MNIFAIFESVQLRPPWTQHFLNFIDNSYCFLDLTDFIFYFFNSAPHSVLKIWKIVLIFFMF